METKTKRQRKRTRLLLGTVLGVALAVAPLFVRADPLDDYLAKQQQLSEKAGAVQSLSDELTVLDQSIAAKSQYVGSLNAQIATVRQQLAKINQELSGLDQGRQQRQTELNRYVRTDYVDGQPNAYFVLAGSGTLSAATQKSSYLGIFKSRTDRLVKELATTERRFDERQRDVISHVQQLDNLETQTSKESQELAAVRASKAQLLADTQGQESTFQRQLDAMRAQLTKLGVFGRSSCAQVGSRVWPETGGYFNQCDSRWADTKLGFSNSSTMGDFGCGVAALAMVFKHYGIDTNPPGLNEDLKRVGAFYDDLLIWGNTGGASQGHLRVTNHSGVDWNQVNSQLAGGNPVIVYIDRGSSSHYVVLLSQDGSTYRMHDSIQGPYLRFSDFYSTGSVQQYITFQKTG